MASKDHLSAALNRAGLQARRMGSTVHVTIDPDGHTYAVVTEQAGVFSVSIYDGGRLIAVEQAAAVADVLTALAEHTIS